MILQILAVILVHYIFFQILDYVLYTYTYIRYIHMTAVQCLALAAKQVFIYKNH